MHRYTLHFELSTADASGAPVCIAGNFNNWNENEYKMKEIGKGAYELELDLEWKNEHPIEYKFIRTRWANVEVDEYGSYVPNRIIEDPQEKIVAWVPRWRSQGEVCDKDLMPLIEFHSLIAQSQKRPPCICVIALRLSSDFKIVSRIVFDGRSEFI